MRLSVVICTWNCSESLRSTLESILALEVPAGLEWELLVVDNGSTDDTQGVLLHFRDSLPLRPLREDRLGVSRARNTGAGQASGELVLFTDDDVVVDRRWLVAYLEAAERWPEAQYFGGTILPRYGPGVPGWVKRNESSLSGMLCRLDLGPETRLFGPGEFPFGPNMAFRRDTLSQYRFDERVGRKGTGQIRGSETSACYAMERDGRIGAWVPDARVLHEVPAQRANLNYVWKYYYGLGRALHILGLAAGPVSAGALRRAGLRAIVGTIWSPSNWIHHVQTFAFLKGRHAESIGGTREEPG